MSVLDSSQHLLTLQQQLHRPGAQQGMKWVHDDPMLWNKDLWCGDVTSSLAVSLFDVWSLLVDEGAKRYPHRNGMKVGRDQERKEGC